MAARKRSARQIEQDRAAIMQLWVRGLDLSQIAQRLEIPVSIVTYDVGAVRHAWETSAVFNFNEQIMTELFRLTMIEAEAWANFELSKQPLTKRKRTKIDEKTVTIGRPGQPILQAAQGPGPGAPPQPPGGPALFNIDETKTGNNQTSQTEGIVNHNGAITVREGNPRWLDIALKCSDQRCQLLRLYEPDMGALVIDQLKVYAGFDPDRV